MADHHEMKEALRRAIAHDRANEQILVSLYPFGPVFQSEISTIVFEHAKVPPNQNSKGRHDEQEENYSTP